MTPAEPDPSALIAQTVDSFWETVPPVWNRIRARVRAQAAERAGLTVEQFHTLRHVRRGAHSVSALAECLQVSRPAVSQAVEALVQKGLLSRWQTDSDRRRMRLDLTAGGALLMDSIFDANRRWMAGRLAACTPDELRALQAGLAVLRLAFDEDVIPEKGNPAL